MVGPLTRFLGNSAAKALSKAKTARRAAKSARKMLDTGDSMVRGAPTMRAPMSSPRPKSKPKATKKTRRGRRRK